MQNIEFKSELLNMEIAQAQCLALEASRVNRFQQTDTYFRLPDGRLKRRTVPGEAIEWIFYYRADRPAPKMSHFMLYTEEQARARWGMLPLREWITVRKVRELYLWNNVRIHLDRVDGLGDFLEFEALVSRKNNVKVCYDEIGRLREAFAPVIGETISSSYSDMLDHLRRIETE